MSTARDESTLAERRRRALMREASSGGVRLNMTPMIDVVFLLLIYFVLVADFARPSAIADLDVVQREEQQSDDPFALPEVPSVLALTSTGDGRTDFAIVSERPAFLGEGDFESTARSAMGTLGPRHPVIVRPEGETRWEHAVVVYRALREVGFERVELEVDR